MTKEIIIKVCNELKKNKSHFDFQGKAAELKNLISSFCGKNNPFYEAANNLKMVAAFSTEQLNSIIDGFVRSVENDLISNVSYERKLKTTVVNDYLAQAEELLQKQEFHPAVAAFLIGASLEEFLRNWVIEQSLYIDGQKTTIDVYCKIRLN